MSRFGRGLPPSTQLLIFPIKQDISQFASIVIDGGGLIFYTAASSRNSTGNVRDAAGILASTFTNLPANTAALVGPAGGWVGPLGGYVGPAAPNWISYLLGGGSLKNTISSTRNATGKVIGATSLIAHQFRSVIEEVGLVLVIVDKNWNRLIFSTNVLSLDIEEELGSAENSGFVSIPASDPAAAYIPNPDLDESEPTRFQVYSNNVLVFAGLIDKTTSRVDEKNILTFGGIQRGGEIAERNFGRRDLLGWPLPEVFRELLRDNIGRAPFATASATNADPKYPPVSAITGEPMEGQHWSTDAVYNGILTIDLGSVQKVDAVRVIPEWSTGKWYTWVLSTSDDNSFWVTRYTQALQIPLGDRGVLVELGHGIQARYIRVFVNGSSDGFSRLASVMTLHNIAEVGPDTTYAVPWIENDDSGNIVASGDTQRVVVDGAFAGDGILGNSYVTQLNSGGSVTHTFRGTSNAAYFTDVDASTADFYVDNVLQQSNVSIPANSYQYKAFEVTGLSSSLHTLKVVQNSGTPRLDYFSGEYKSSYRVIQEDATMIGYSGKWIREYNDAFSGYSVKLSSVAGDQFLFPFYGDSVKAKFAYGPNKGKADWYVDEVLQGTVDFYNASYLNQIEGLSWAGSYASHTLRVVIRSDKNISSVGTNVSLDSIEGNWAHILYLRSASDTNLALIGRLSEMTNTFMRLNYDGSVDLLAATATDSGEIIREGENEGGNIESAEVEGDWSNAVSAVLALGRGTDNLALKVFVVDKNAVARLGVKVAKFESRDVVDAYLLVRQAWQVLQDSQYPKRNYRVDWRRD